MVVSATQSQRKPAPFTYLLGIIFCLFIGILIFVYVVTKKTSPVYLDEHGKPVNQSQTSGGNR